MKVVQFSPSGSPELHVRSNFLLGRIVRGQTVFSISRISDLTSFLPDAGTISPTYTEDDLMLITNIGFRADNQIVTHVAFQVREMKKVEASNGEVGLENVFNDVSFGGRTDDYMLPNLLSEMGIPESVMIAAHAVQIPKGGSGGFDVLLLFPNQGVLVNYTMQGSRVGSAVNGCPKNAHAQLELYPSGQPDSFLEGLKRTDWAIKMTGYKPLEEITSMSVQEFYDIFREPTDKCIETPAKLWPTPEP